MRARQSPGEYQRYDDRNATSARTAPMVFAEQCSTSATPATKGPMMNKTSDVSRRTSLMYCGSSLFGR
jgi:hypothetical protein